jgi:hypothetical protein
MKMAANTNASLGNRSTNKYVGFISIRVDVLLTVDAKHLFLGGGASVVLLPAQQNNTLSVTTQ